MYHYLGNTYKYLQIPRNTYEIRTNTYNYLQIPRNFFALRCRMMSMNRAVKHMRGAIAQKKKLKSCSILLLSALSLQKLEVLGRAIKEQLYA